MKDFRVSPANPATVPSWSADEDANRLMDDVFSDIDSLLSGKQPSAKIQTASQGDYASIDSLVVPPADFDGAPFEAEEIVETPIVIKRGWGYYSERLLLIGSSATLLAVALWLAVNDRLIPQFLSSSTAVVEAEAEVVAEPIFANYVQRALDNIDRQPSAQPIPVTGQPQVGMPLAPDQNPAANGQSPQVVERIYIPVYPPEAAVGTQPPVQSAPPVIVTAPPVAPAPNPPQPAQPSAALPNNLIMPPPPLATVPTLPAPPAAAKDVYTLSGVLDSGDRSAALFNVNGVTQRFKVGEMIGSSNWKLISLRANQVLIGQGGQTKTLYAGESFSVDQ